MRLLPTLCLLALAPNVALGACNADNVLRALQRYSAQASPFCSTYTQPPPNQPLPTYVSQYPASRVSSGCSCLITSTSSSTPPPSPTPTPDDCKSDRIINGDFQDTLNAESTYWYFPGEVRSPYDSDSYALTTSSSSNYNYLANFYITNNSTRFGGQTISITENTKPFCGGSTYKLTYTSGITINGGVYMGVTCSVDISLGSQQLVHIGPPNGDPPPFTRQTRSTTFTAGASGSQTFRVAFSCTAPSGFYQIDDISIVGV